MGAFIELFAEDISYFSNWVNKETERKEAWKQCIWAGSERAIRKM